MPIKLQLHNNGGLPNSSSVRNIEDARGRLNIHKDDDNGVVVAAAKYYRPYFPGQLFCRHYAKRGICPNGPRCRFSHSYSTANHRMLHRILYLGGPERVGAPDCEFYLKRGTCSFGPYCKKHHPPDRYGAGPLVLNSLDLPKRPGERCCIFYMKNRHCVFGVACRYHHPEPVTTRTSPDYTHANYGPTGSSAVTLTDQLSSGRIPSFSFPAASSSSDQDLQRVRKYTPLVISPSQGVSPLYGGSSYLQGNTSCVPYARVSGGAVIYSTCLGALNYSSLFPTFFNYLPVRPDQPECREFMNSGTCRFGFSCRYHHPREEKAQMRTYFIRPLGFPSRPVLYSRYTLSGLYKYGLTSRYVEPSVGGSFLYQRSSPSFFHLPEKFPRPGKVTVTVRRPEVAAAKNQKPDASRAHESSKEEHSLPSVGPANDQSAR